MYSTKRSAARYFGLVPCQDASAGFNRLGHITKQGPPTARKYLVEGTWQAVRRSPTVRAYFERICGEKPERKKIAVVATAHYLLRCMWAMLRSGEARGGLRQAIRSAFAPRLGRRAKAERMT